MSNITYNKEYIGDYSTETYNSCLNDLTKLRALKNNYLKRYKNNSEDYDGTLCAIKESLDHYVLKKITENPQFLGTTQGQNYIKYISELINEEPTELYNNVVCRNSINDDNIRKYLQRNLKFNMNEKYSSIREKTSAIFKRIEKNAIVSQEELDIICATLVDRRLPYEPYTQVIKYIYNNLNDPNFKLKCSLQVTNAILNYVPLYAAKNCEEYRQRRFDPTSTRYYVVDKYQNKKYDSYGTSYYSAKQVIFSKERLKKIRFDSIKSSEATFDFMSCEKEFEYDYCSLILISAHELSHQFQKNESTKEEIEDTGFMHIRRMILDKELKDYKTNHDNDDIEINATEIGWHICESFFEKIANLNELRRRAYVNINGTKARYGFAYKKDIDGNLIIKDEYDYKYLNQIMRNKSKREKYFKEYPMLKKIYNDDGKVSCMKVLTLPNSFTLYSNGPTIGATYVSKVIEGMAHKPELKNKYIKEISAIKGDLPIENILNNIYSTTTILVRNIDQIEYYTRKEFDKRDIFKKITISAQFINGIKDEYTKRYNSNMLILKELQRQNNPVLSKHVSGYIKNMENQQQYFYKQIMKLIDRTQLNDKKEAKKR